MERNLEDDGLFIPPIKAHSLGKIIRHDSYARAFSTAAKTKWPQRAYIGLYSGSGRARIETSGEIIETTPMGAIRVPDRFTHYVFVGRDEQSTNALKQRIATIDRSIDAKVLTGDVNDMVPRIKAELPNFSRAQGLLSLCFVDPFAANLKFATLRSLAHYWMDFLVILMLGRDVRTNFKKYYEDETDIRIAELIDCEDWRDQFQATGGSVVKFTLRKFDEAMKGLDYLPCTDDLVHQVKFTGKNVFLYSLVLYSRSGLGQKLWRGTLRSSDPQLGLDF